MSEYVAIRNIMLELLEMMFQAPDVSATQQMGVQLSNAVKREGVVIIQNQNVEVMARIGPSVLKVIRMCEEIADRRLEPLVLEAPRQPEVLPMASENPVRAACEYFFERGTKWEEMQDTMRTHYINYVVDHCGTRREAAEMMGVGPTYLSKMLNQPKKPKTLMEVLQ